MPVVYESPENTRGEWFAFIRGKKTIFTIASKYGWSFQNKGNLIRRLKMLFKLGYLGEWGTGELTSTDKEVYVLNTEDPEFGVFLARLDSLKQ